LWQVKAADSDKVSYIFGTMHAVPEKDFSMPDIVKKKISECEAMYQEVDMSNLDQMKVLKLMMLPDGKSLSDYISEEEYQEYKELLMKFDITESQVEYLSKMKPIAAYGLILTSVYENPKMYEQELLTIANEQGLEIGGLETLEYQIALFDSIPVKEQLEMLYEDNFEKELKRLVKIYTKQKVNEMVEMISESEMSSSEAALLHTRNHNWVEKLAVIIPEKSVFVAVGAGHLAGEQGLIHLLREKGFEVVPVEFKF
jgi:uncharacterized protein YbaP (TraB family)